MKEGAVQFMKSFEDLTSSNLHFKCVLKFDSSGHRNCEGNFGYKAVQKDEGCEF